MMPLHSQKLLTWFDRQISEQLYITSVSVAEILYGLHVLPKGKRRIELETAFAAVMDEAFIGRILAFDEKSAQHYGKIMGQSKEKGRPMSFCDGQIAAIASLHGFQLATRNIKDFKNCLLSLINPFD
jgi:predicted nucleic acid-binding protein